MPKDVDRTTLITDITTVDKETGEIISNQKVTHIKVGTEPNYIKLYVDTLLAFKELPKTLNPLLIELLACMTYADQTAESGGQLIVINAFIKQKISNKLKMKVNTIDKSLSSLVKSGLLKRIGTGTYQVNPHLFGKGEWKEIKAIRAKFDFNTGEVETEITTETDIENSKREAEELDREHTEKARNDPEFAHGLALIEKIERREAERIALLKENKGVANE